MARRLVENDAEVVADFQTFIRLRESKKPEKRQKYASFLRKAKILVVEKIDEKREYAPSRFVGYRRNTLAAHKADLERDDTVTTPKPEQIYGQKWTYDEEEAQRYVRFCKRHGIEKDISQLSTPLKFIFAGFHSPSALATRVKTVSASEVKEAEDTPFHETRRMLEFPLNQILYGPPGTGKTYHTAINRAKAPNAHLAFPCCRAKESVPHFQ